MQEPFPSQSFCRCSARAPCCCSNDALRSGDTHTSSLLLIPEDKLARIPCLRTHRTRRSARSATGAPARGSSPSHSRSPARSRRSRRGRRRTSSCRCGGAGSGGAVATTAPSAWPITDLLKTATDTFAIRRSSTYPTRARTRHEPAPGTSPHLLQDRFGVDGPPECAPATRAVDDARPPRSLRPRASWPGHCEGLLALAFPSSELIGRVRPPPRDLRNDVRCSLAGRCMYADCACN
jgi:hypothetical protein